MSKTNIIINIYILTYDGYQSENNLKTFFLYINVLDIRNQFQYLIIWRTEK